MSLRAVPEGSFGRKSLWKVSEGLPSGTSPRDLPQRLPLETYLRDFPQGKLESLKQGSIRGSYSILTGMYHKLLTCNSRVYYLHGFQSWLNHMPLPIVAICYQNTDNLLEEILNYYYCVFFRSIDFLKIMNTYPFHKR